MLLELCKSAPHIMASDMCPVGERSITSSLITPIIIFIFLSWGGAGGRREGAAVRLWRQGGQASAGEREGKEEGWWRKALLCLHF